MEASFLVTNHTKFNECDEFFALKLLTDSPRQQMNLLMKQKYTLDFQLVRGF